MCVYIHKQCVHTCIHCHWPGNWSHRAMTKRLMVCMSIHTFPFIFSVSIGIDACPRPRQWSEWICWMASIWIHASQAIDTLDTCPGIYGQGYYRVLPTHFSLKYRSPPLEKLLQRGWLTNARIWTHARVYSYMGLIPHELCVYACAYTYMDHVYTCIDSHCPGNLCHRAMTHQLMVCVSIHTFSLLLSVSIHIDACRRPRQWS